MADNLQHILAASCAVLDMERAISSGRIPDDLEMLLREATARTRIAFKFGLPSDAICNDNDYESLLAVHSSLNREESEHV